MAMRAAVIGAILFVSPAAAQVGGLQMSGPPPFGLLLGDVFTLKTRLDVAQPFRLDPASLPKPGAITYWLDLKGLKITESPAPSGGVRYEIAAEYQTFYAPLEAIEQIVPPFTLAVTDAAGKRVEAKSGSWRFLTSPLRPVVGVVGGDGSVYSLRPDVLPVRPSLRSAEIAVAGAAGATALCGLLLAWSRAWPPFHRRPARPFARAARIVAKAAKPGEDGWRRAALALHRAFDAAAGRRLLGEDLGVFLSSRPAFRRHEAAIADFFAASRAAFFGGARTPSDDLSPLAKSLAAAERAS